MIVGNGLLANTFTSDYIDDDLVVIFASGVSNSSENDKAKFLREKQMIIDTLESQKELMFIYFSTVSVLKRKTPYTEHKLEMEKIIKKSGNKYLIIRLPQVFGNGGNKNNIINLFCDKIRNNKTIEVWNNMYRSIIDVDDVLKIVNHVLINSYSKEILNIHEIERTKVENLINLIGIVLNKEPKIKLVDKEMEPMFLNNTDIESIINELGIKRHDYTRRVIEKWLA